MIETNEYSSHIAGIVPVAGQKLGFNMPWHDSLIPVHDNYHAIERAVNSLAIAGCNTIWIVLHRETQPIIRKKIGEWIYDPRTRWISPRPFWTKREVPIYYVAINPKDRDQRDSYAWSCLYGAKVSSYISRKISKWVVPKRFLVVSPYGLVDEKILDANRDLLRRDKNILYTYNNKTFLDDEFLPFTFDQDGYEQIRKNFRERYFGNTQCLKLSEVFGGLDTSNYLMQDSGWYHRIDNWDNYREFIASEHNKECVRPKYIVSHEWNGLVKNTPKRKDNSNDRRRAEPIQPPSEDEAGERTSDGDI